MSDWSERILCSDGNCVGTINEKGYCSICGKPSGRKQNSEQDFLEGMQEVKVREQKSRKGIRNTADIAVLRVIEAGDDFGFRLLLQLAKQRNNKNIFISPFSVAMALAMIYNGAENPTKQAMAETLGLTGLSLQEINSTNKGLMSLQAEFDPDIQLSIANSIWIREGVGLCPEFIRRIGDDYGGEIANLDFSASGAAETINKWVADKTKEKIKAIVRSEDILNPLAILLLINAIYFKGIWEHRFDQAKTTNRHFNFLDGTQKKCPMMVQFGMYRYYQDPNFQAISLPYSDGQFSMYIFLPHRSSSIKKFQINLNMRNWRDWTSEFCIRPGQIVLPRFRLEYGASLKDALVALGMGTAFEAGANFQGMGTGPFWISDLIHKSFVEVSEKGTEATAATATMVFGSRSLLQEEGFTMIVDHPFFAAIFDNNSSTMLFTGFILDPT